MTNNTDKIIAALTESPGSTAQEIGTSPVTMQRLEGSGLVIRVGTRSTGKRGRPPVTWAVAGADVKQEEKVTANVAAAIARCDAYSEWCRALNNKVSMKDQGLVMPPTPSINDYVLAGKKDAPVKDEESGNVV